MPSYSEDSKKKKFKATISSKQSKYAYSVSAMKRWKLSKFSIEPLVFWGSAILLLILVVFNIFAADALMNTLNNIQALFTKYANWVYILALNIFVIFAIYLIFSRFGNIRLGGAKSKPEFSNFAWIAMLFSAGMGIGLVFHGSYEPLHHYMNSPLTDSQTIEAAKTGMALSIFHWGVHPWTIYALASLALAYFHYNHKLPLTIHSLFYPIFGKAVFGKLGKFIDIITVLTILAGLVPSIGIGAQTVTSGLIHVTGIKYSNLLLGGTISIIAIVAIISVVSGLRRGVNTLSKINVGLAFILLIFIFCTGSTLDMINAFIQNMGLYVSNFVGLSTLTPEYGDTALHKWQSDWTIMYWAWWIAWAPFVGMFVARISKGRTIKELLIGVITIPSFITCIWFTVFGNTAINMQMSKIVDFLPAVMNNPSMVTFSLLEQMPLQLITSLFFVVLLIVFLVTSLDSGALVIDAMTSKTTRESLGLQKAFWVILIALISYLLLINGGLKALQVFVTVAGLPFAFAMILMCYSLYKGLIKSKSKEDNY